MTGRPSQTNGRRERPSRVRLGFLVAGVAALTVAAVWAVSGATPFAIAGFTAKINNGTNTAATAPYFKCSSAEAADTSGSLFQYYLNEASGSTTAVDSDGNSANGTYQGTMTTSTTTPIACSRDVGGAYVLNGSSSFVSTPTSYANPTTFSEEVWFKTTVAGGLLIGFGSNQVSSSGQHDRQIYLNTSGKLVFGTYNSAVQVVTSPKAYNDGSWHHVASTMSASTGMRLYVDGALVASNANYTAPENATGYFRVGYDTISGWPGTSSNYYFTGQMRYAAVYSTVLTAQQISNHYAAGQ
ncbi:concanavalin A-like lectin/glucanase superfamily protein [Frondihabitans sp. PhB188]|uniref:LamG domain-containing protein n=1 Tax=Frondihabitans sp. PhB188 TaxID=2485200 RepID=UPI000FA05139|nr:LamG domain-containing protein [Frondihabitans sp. PhB188]ROQ30935.1 concanavalin A-like lectin/glucanase superfamily protein [Frondihabitans sp. PhB188]